MEDDDDIYYQLSNKSKKRMSTIYYIIIAIFSYILPIILFGNIHGYNLIYLSITCCILLLVANYKVTQDIRWISYIYSFLHGFFMSYFGVSILGLTVKSPMLTINAYISSIPAILSIIIFNIFISIYRDKKKEEYLKQFDDKISLDRDMKINKIIGNIFNT